MTELLMAAGPYKPLVLLLPLLIAMIVALWYTQWFSSDDHGKAELLFWTALVVSTALFLLMSWVAVWTSTWYFFAAGCLSFLGIALVFELPVMKRLDKQIQESYIDDNKEDTMEGLIGLLAKPDGEYEVAGRKVEKVTQQDGQVIFTVHVEITTVSIDLKIDKEEYQ